MGDTAHGSWTSRELGIYVAKERFAGRLPVKSAVNQASSSDDKKDVQARKAVFERGAVYADDTQTNRAGVASSKVASIFPMSQAITIEMPGGMTSRPHECRDDEETLKILKGFGDQMRSWPDFEASLVVLEDGKEISRERIRT